MLLDSVMGGTADGFFSIISKKNRWTNISLAIERDPRYEHWRRRLFALTWLVYFGFYLTRYSFSASKGSFDLPYMDEATMGLIDSVYLISYAIGQFIWGALADKVGPRRILLVRHTH